MIAIPNILPKRATGLPEEKIRCSAYLIASLAAIIPWVMAEEVITPSK